MFDETTRVLRVKRYALRTEQAYTAWIRRFILFHGKRHPRDMGGAEVEAFLSDLAVRGNVAAGTQNQALSAILFLYREVLALELPWLNTVVRAKRPQRVLTVLGRDEVTRLLALTEGKTGVRLQFSERRPWVKTDLLHEPAAGELRSLSAWSLNGIPAPAA